MVNPITLLMLALSGEPPYARSSYPCSYAYGTPKARLRQYDEPPAITSFGYLPAAEAPDLGSGMPRRRGTRLVNETRGSPPAFPPLALDLISVGCIGA